MLRQTLILALALVYVAAQLEPPPAGFDEEVAALDVPLEDDETGALDVPLDDDETGALDVPLDDDETGALNVPLDDDETVALDVPVEDDEVGTLDVPLDEEEVESGDVVVPLDFVPAGDDDIKRTVIFIEKWANPDEELFIRGGVGGHTGCTHNVDDAVNDPCAIAIQHDDLGLDSETPTRDEWSEGDNFLSWGGAEEGQSRTAQGTPAQWTTSNEANDYFSPLNTYGEHHWMIDITMDCTDLENGFFEFKGIMQDGTWESDINNSGRCSGAGAEDPGFESNNHIARCGYVNTFTWGQSGCTIEPLNGTLSQ